jgi:hypothetical protein
MRKIITNRVVILGVVVAVIVAAAVVAAVLASRKDDDEGNSLSGNIVNATTIAEKYRIDGVVRVLSGASIQVEGGGALEFTGGTNSTLIFEAGSSLLVAGQLPISQALGANNATGNGGLIFRGEATVTVNTLRLSGVSVTFEDVPGGAEDDPNAKVQIITVVSEDAVSHGVRLVNSDIAITNLAVLRPSEANVVLEGSSQLVIRTELELIGVDASILSFFLEQQSRLVFLLGASVTFLNGARTDPAQKFASSDCDDFSDLLSATSTGGLATKTFVSKTTVKPLLQAVQPARVVSSDVTGFDEWNGLVTISREVHVRAGAVLWIGKDTQIKIANGIIGAAGNNDLGLPALVFDSGSTVYTERNAQGERVLRAEAAIGTARNGGVVVAGSLPNNITRYYNAAPSVFSDSQAGKTGICVDKYAVARLGGTTSAGIEMASITFISTDADIDAVEVTDAVGDAVAVYNTRSWLKAGQVTNPSRHGIVIAGGSRAVVGSQSLFSLNAGSSTGQNFLLRDQSQMFISGQVSAVWPASPTASWADVVEAISGDSSLVGVIGAGTFAALTTNATISNW